MVSHVLVTLVVTVLVVPPLTVVEMEVDVLQSSADCVSQFPGATGGMVTLPSGSMVMGGQGPGKLPLRVTCSGHLMGGGPMMTTGPGKFQRQPPILTPQLTQIYKVG